VHGSGFMPLSMQPYDAVLRPYSKTCNDNDLRQWKLLPDLFAALPNLFWVKIKIFVKS
jgi:hypothetical protein